MSFFSSGPATEVDQNDYDEEEQSQTGELDYYGDGLDDFQSDDVYGDEYDTSQNTQLNGGEYVGAHFAQSRAESDGYSSADGEGQDTVDGGGIAINRDEDDQVVVDHSMQMDTQTPSRATINDGSSGSSENDNFRDVLKTNEAHDKSISVEPLLTAAEESESMNHVEDPKIKTHSVDPIGMTEEQVTVLPEIIPPVGGSSKLLQQGYNASENTSHNAEASERFSGLEATDPLVTVLKSGVGNDPLKRQIGTTDLDAAADDDRAANLSRRQSEVPIRAAPGAGQSQGITDGGMRQINRKVDNNSQGLRRRFESVPKSTLSTHSLARGPSTLIRPAVLPIPHRRNAQNSAVPTTMSSPGNDLHSNSAAGHGSILLRRGISDPRGNDRRVPIQSTPANSFSGSSGLMEEPAMQIENTLRSSTPSSMVLSNNEFSSYNSKRRVNGPTISEPVAALSSREQHQYLSVQHKTNTAYDRSSDTAGDSSEHPEGNLRSSQINITGNRSISIDDRQHRSPTDSELPIGKRVNYGARTERSSAAVPLARAGSDTPAEASANPQRRSSSNGDLESRIDAIISTTSKRLRDIQQDNGSSNFLEDVRLGSSDPMGGSQKALTELKQRQSEGISAGSRERDCNVPAFVLALERDSLTLAGALCRLMSKDALLLAPSIFDAEKSINALRESLKS